MKGAIILIYCAVVLIGSAFLFCAAAVTGVRRTVDLVYLGRSPAVNRNYATYETFKAHVILECSAIKDDSLRGQYRAMLDDQTLRRRYEGEKQHLAGSSRFGNVRKLATSMLFLLFSAALFVSHFIFLRDLTASPDGWARIDPPAP